MFTIEMQKECGCFKKSDYVNPIVFKSKDDALMQARLMENHMNREFCQKHFFTAVEEGKNKIVIQVEERKKEESRGGGCCGGGHCS
ncbi:MAG: hypothetical protein LGB68_05580 [Sulfurovum sp.]|nr:hypothetical protein [Sulfurovum sp.]MCB4749792.1 hypothetical protein [Sulfurovum sp.]MCB4759082.1 hypothetical protein [Sulfurovum sp.]MCB4762630.1 hypothetical protein [Sulfurovum sp.]